MNRFLVILLGGIIVAGFCPAEASSENARDLYLSYQSEGNTSAGQPGANVRIELNRDKNYVSHSTVFQSGDSVRFHFAVNFTGYVAVINNGSSGRRALLFPYQGVSNRVTPTSDFRVPKGKDWFTFDRHPGEENLTFIMSTKPIAEVSQLMSSSTGGTGAGAVSTGGTANATEEQEILAALNSRALTRGRDLFLDVQGDDGYIMSSTSALAEPQGFSLTLAHR